MPSPLAANPVDAAALADELARYRVVDQPRLDELLAEFPGGDAAALADYLVRRGALTDFQADRALAGEAPRLVLGPYRLTGLAGRGTFGPLFSAAHTAKPDSFVLRVMPLRNLWKARQAKQLARTLTAGIAHPAVVPLVEVDSANGFHYLVWPRDEGERLSEGVDAGGPLAPGDAVAVLGHLANALAACHARGVAHGALTPGCVSIGANGLPRLLELGAGALLAQNLDADESLFDTMSAAFASAAVLAFAAPELAVSPLVPTAAGDQYALAAVGYFALTGLAPYPHPALAEQLRAKRAGPPPSVAVVNPDVPPELAAVLDRMMAPDPADRFASLAEVEEQLAALAISEPSPDAEPLEPESLMLSRLRAGGKSGSISWTATGSGALRPAERDDSDASVTFDLPEAAETVPDALPELSLAAAPRLTRARAPGRSRRQNAANRLFGALNEDDAAGPPAPPDPRLSAPTPVQWHTTGADDETQSDQLSGMRVKPEAAAPAPPANSVVWKKVRRNLLFWQAPRDAVQVSVFGPSAATPGQTVRLTIFLHTPDAAANVRTLSRAFQHDAELIGTGYLAREVPRGAEPAVHVSVANAGIAKTLVKFVWRGQPHKLGFDLHVPWESAEGWSPGLVSVGLNDVRVGKVEFALHVLPRKA